MLLPRINARNGWACRWVAGILATVVLLTGAATVRAQEKDEEVVPEKKVQVEKKAREPAPDEKPPVDKPRDKVKRKPATDFPRFDDVFKGIKGLDPEQAKELRQSFEKMRKEIEQARQEMRQMFEQLRKEGRIGPPMFPGPGVRPPFPGFPPDAFPKPREGRLGIMVSPPSPVLSQQLGLDEEQGLVIENVRPDSPAAKAGLKEHDILVRFGGQAVTSDPLEFRQLIEDAKADEPLELEVIRQGKRQTLKELRLPAVQPEARQRFQRLPRSLPGAVVALPIVRR